ncbi:MAG: tRNA pseudouridine(13) synthase TruD [Candidatus Korarchaeota archaeon]
MIIDIDSFDSRIGISGFLYGSSRYRAEQKSLEDFIVEEILHGEIAKVKKANEIPRAKIRGLFRFVLVKKGLGTREAIRLLAHDLGIKQSCFKVCGFKDAWGVTAQYVTVEGEVNASKIRKRKYMWVREFVPSKHHINRQIHDGNRFTVRLYLNEKVDPHFFLSFANRFGLPYEDTEKGIKISLLPFPNFYTFQRFGSTRLIAHEIGLCLLKKDYKGVLSLFIGNSSKLESKRLQRARAIYRKNPDPSSVASLFPASSLERYMLSYLARHPKGYKDLIRKIPSMTLVMWIQAVQSYMFNLLLSERLNEKPESLVRKIINEPELVSILDDNMLPIPGTETDIDNPYWGKSLQRICNKLGISLDNFNTDYGVFSGSTRPGITVARDISIKFDTTSMQITFTLPPGAYAYAFLREFFSLQRRKSAKEQ